MTQIYTLLYIDRKYPENTDILGVYTTRNDAITNLIKKAGYLIDKNNQLTQFGLIQTSHATFESLYKYIDQEMMLLDDENDIYRLVSLVIP